MDMKNSKRGSPIFKVEVVPRLQRMQWTKSFDAYLATLVGKSKNWKEIARSMSLRFPEENFNSKKCRARWKNCINPELNRHYLTAAEELLLIAYHSFYKNQWSKISKQLPKRHSNILRNSFYGAMRKLIQKIVDDTKMAIEINPLLFLQNFYITTFIKEILEETETPKQENLLAPSYIYKYVEEKKLSKKVCENYVIRLRDVLLESYPSRPILSLMKAYSYEDLKKFFGQVTEIIDKSVSPETHITDTFILDMFELALGPFAPPTPCGLSYQIVPLYSLPRRDSVPYISYSTLSMASSSFVSPHNLVLINKPN